MNRSFKFEEVVNHYESLPHRASLKETQQYYYAKLHQKLEATHSNLLYKPAQINTIPVNLIKQNSISDHFYNILTAAVIVFLGYTTYKSYSTDIPDLSNINITFKDVKGIDECREELEEVVDLLKNRKKYQKIGAKVPKGILLVGKPGTGKTLLAKAIAGEAGVKFIACSGSEFDEIFVGVGAKKVRTLFENAKKVAPAIIFIDEIDAVGGTRRGRFGPGPHQQTLNQLLVEMDGFDTADNIIVIGATNIPDGLDEALKRPGRFDKIVDVPVPNLKSRTEILDLYLSKIQIDSTVTSEKIAQTTTGFTGADLANLVNTGMLTAIKAGRSICSILDIETAKDRILLGVPNRSLEFTEKEKLCLAIHEIGHVLAILYTQGSEDLHKTSILLRGSNYGKTSLIPNKEQLNITRKQALANLDVLIAGRVMQELMLPTPDISTQCEKDLIQANNNANTFVTIGLFNELFGLAYIENKDEMGPETRNKIDSSVQYLLQESYKRVKRLLQGKLEIAKELSVALAQRETMSKQEVIDLIDNFKR